MNDFTELLKEAFVGEEPYDSHPAREELEASLRTYERRERTLRYMLWLAVAFMSCVAYYSAWKFLTSDEEASTKQLILYAVLFLWSSTCIGWAKMFLLNTQKHLSILKELKRVQLALALQRESSNAERRG